MRHIGLCHGYVDNMIQIIDEKPEALQKYPDHFIWIEGRDKKGPYGYGALEKVGETVSLHWDFTRWTHNVAKQFKKDFGDIVKICKVIMVNEIIAVRKQGEEDDIFGKFAKFMGFPDPLLIWVTKMRI